MTIVSNAFLRNNGAVGYGYDYDRSQIYDETGKNYYYLNQRGNHYSEFIEPDDNGDGVVDDEYVFQGVNDTDAYPLVRTPMPTFEAPSFQTITSGSANIYLVWDQPEMIYGGILKGYRLYMSENRGPYKIKREMTKKRLHHL